MLWFNPDPKCGNMRSLAMDVASYLYFFITQGPHAAQALVGRLTIEWPLKRKKKEKESKLTNLRMTAKMREKPFDFDI